MRDTEADDFMGLLLAKLDNWGIDCRGRGVSCGKVLKTTTGTGKGQKVVQMVIGPFRN